MTIGWDAFSAGELRDLAAALRHGRVAPRPSSMSLQHYCTASQAQWLAEALASMQADAATLATFLDLVATERSRGDAGERAVDLVWTGPEMEGMQTRDTGAVVRELFSSAQRSVLVAGYAIHRGREVFATLADRMAARPDLRVRLVVDIPRRAGDTTIDLDLVHRYANDFRQKNWPGECMPEVFFDPRSLDMDQSKRSAMHAKCVVIDNEVALITSANFTTAAQTKNIEVGALIRHARVAAQLEDHFNTLLAAGLLRALPFPTTGSESPVDDSQRQ